MACGAGGCWGVAFCVGLGEVVGLDAGWEQWGGRWSREGIEEEEEMVRGQWSCGYGGWTMDARWFGGCGKGREYRGMGWKRVERVVSENTDFGEVDLVLLALYALDA